MRVRLRPRLEAGQRKAERSERLTVFAWLRYDVGYNRK